MGSRVLLVGSGAREHAVAWKLRQSPDLDELLVAPGNAGTAQLATNIPVQPKDIDGLVKAAVDHRVDFYLATMDDPQPLGLVDRLQARGILCYGPSAAASRIEASKWFAKSLMEDLGIPTARGRSFTVYDEATQYLGTLPDRPIVVKADGLAAGKGVIVCTGHEDAAEALDIIMRRRDFGSAGDRVIIEERLQGWEVSAHAFCDGRSARLMPFATDYKRAGDGDIGLNTGGMGAYSPSANISGALRTQIESEVVGRLLDGMADRGYPFNGTLFPGLMVTADGPRVLEYNARFGDPETQVLMPRLESDLLAITSAAAEGKLADEDIRWSSDAAVGVVLASGGYPATYKLSYLIEGLENLDDGVMAFHAGTSNSDRGLVTNGGRVLTIVATGATVEEARARAYDNVRRVHFTDMHYRRDIAAGVLTPQEAR
jgi:phosphoribosylamine--glycine ligase